MSFPACTNGLIFASGMAALKLIASHAVLQLEPESTFATPKR
jgi:hypothetical protein